MDVTPLIEHGQNIIQAYSAQGFKVSGQSYAHPIFMTPTHIEEWPIEQGVTVETLTQSHFEKIVQHTPKSDVLLLGTGKVMSFLSPALKRALKEQGLNIEVMDSGAACRTYNVLMAEGRHVACALIPG